jgi:uncharacterized protein (TIGR02117 family)
MAVIGLYVLAGVVGGMLPANGDWRPATPGDVTVWVESNGIHTGIIVPKVAAGIDWRGLARPEHLADPRYARWSHLSFGWGERTFYLETPSWWDVRPATVLAAAIGSGRTLMHVDHLPRPRPGDGARPIRLSAGEYRRLAAYIRASFAGRPAPIRGYGANDVFYEARGRYSAFRTCNAWTGSALRTAGVRVGRWTPFPDTVMWWFDND